MTEARNRIASLAKRDDAAPRKVVKDPDDNAKSAEALSREAAQKIFDRIHAARLAHRRNGVKNKTD